MKRRVVVTGIGILTSNAEGIEAFSDALLSGTSGIGEITQFSTGAYACKISGEIKYIPFESEPESHLDRASMLAVRAARGAMKDAGFSADDGQVSRVANLGVVVGTTCGGVLSLEKVSEAIATGADLSAIPDWRVEEMSFHAPTLQVARSVLATGPVVTITVACASGAHAVGYGMDYLRAGRTDVVLAGGVDVISRFIYRGFAALNGLGAPPYRAFDADRNGVVLGEGAGFLVLESLEHAQARGARIYAELLGHSFNNDGAHIVNPNPTGEGIARSFRMALSDAGLTVDDIDHINAHGTGTIANDSAESAAIQLAFGERASAVPVASIKPMLGHTSGAAGAIELIAAIVSLNKGVVPPTINLVQAAPDCPLNLSAELRHVPLTTVMSANSGFGGSNAAVVVSQLRAAESDDRRQDTDQAPRVVITGVGVALPSGIESVDALWEQLGKGPLQGTPGSLGQEITPFDVFVRTGLPISKDARRMDTFSQYAVLAGHLALQDAGIAGADFGESLGLVLGSAYACLESNERFSAGLSKVKVNPVIYQNTVSNAVTGYMCIMMGLRGSVSVLNQGWLSGAAALAYGYELVKGGRCRAVLAGGAERLCQMTALTLERAHALSPSRVGLPYHAQSDGALPSDGAGFLVLETLESAQARGATILAEVTGAGIHSAAGQTPEQAVTSAVKEALGETTPGAPLLIVGNGNGVSRLDRQELRALETVAKDLQMKAVLSPVKAALGETLGAAGALATIVGAVSLARHEVRGPVYGTEVTGGVPQRLEPETAPDRVLITNLDEDGSCVALALRAMPIT